VAKKLVFRKDHFNFGFLKNKKAYIYFRRNATKIVVTLTDLDHKVIFSCGTGAIDGSRRFRRSPYVIEPIFLRVLFFLRMYKIFVLDIILRMRISGHVFSFIKECIFRGILVSRIIERYSLPHNGVRICKQPRK
jgi:ribosomal protein S11